MTSLWITCVRRAHAVTQQGACVGRTQSHACVQNYPQTRMVGPFLCVRFSHASARKNACVRACLYRHAAHVHAGIDAVKAGRQARKAEA